VAACTNGDEPDTPDRSHRSRLVGRGKTNVIEILDQRRVGLGAGGRGDVGVGAPGG
jgi:hypothetical protein